MPDVAGRARWGGVGWGGVGWGGVGWDGSWRKLVEGSRRIMAILGYFRVFTNWRNLKRFYRLIIVCSYEANFKLF
jgi:hypothetical protein